MYSACNRRRIMIAAFCCFVEKTLIEFSRRRSPPLPRVCSRCRLGQTENERLIERNDCDAEINAQGAAKLG